MVEFISTNLLISELRRVGIAHPTVYLWRLSTLKTLERYGIVELVKDKGKVIPKVKAKDLQVEFSLDNNLSHIADSAMV